jgi:hypothetical protein
MGLPYILRITMTGELFPEVEKDMLARQWTPGRIDGAASGAADLPPKP